MGLAEVAAGWDPDNVVSQLGRAEGAVAPVYGRICANEEIAVTMQGPQHDCHVMPSLGQHHTIAPVLTSIKSARKWPAVCR
jgi:hypothetical protein